MNPTCWSFEHLLFHCSWSFLRSACPDSAACSALCLTTEACCLLSCLFLQAVYLLLQLLVGLQSGHTVIGGPSLHA